MCSNLFCVFVFPLVVVVVVFCVVIDEVNVKEKMKGGFFFG